MKHNPNRTRILLLSLLVVATGLHSSLFAQTLCSNFDGVKVGVITYSWRSMSYNADEIIKFCKESGNSSIELMGNVAEDYAGIPEAAPRMPKNLSDSERALRKDKIYKANEARRLWRLNAPMEKYTELKKKFEEAGIEIHAVKFSPAKWSDKEIDYAFEAAKLLGAKGITNEIGENACKRLGKFAEKHNMFAIYHNHLQPGEEGFDFGTFLSYSPNNMLNFDVGHYIGATGKNPTEILKKYHERIFSIHLKDKTSKNNTTPNTNKVWGEGDTPIAELLRTIQKNHWPIYCDIELEYPIPSSSNAVKETKICTEFCKQILM